MAKEEICSTEKRARGALLVASARGRCGHPGDAAAGTAAVTMLQLLGDTAGWRFPLVSS